MTTTTGTATPSQEDWRALLGKVRQARQLMDEACAPLASEVMRAVDEDVLLEVHGELADGKRAWDRLMASTSGEIGRRSGPEHGKGGLARKRGFKNPAEMIAADGGGSQREARTLIEAGQAMADAQDQERKEREAKAAGKPAPVPQEPVYPVVAAALSEGRIGVDAASAITRMLDSVRAVVPRSAIVGAERRLVDKAPGLTAEQFHTVVRRHLAWLRADAAEERQKLMAAERYFTIKEQPDGSVEMRGRLDPVSAAPLRAALDGMVKDAFRERRDGDPLVEDTRTPGQIRADAMVTFARHMLGCDQAPTRPSTTIAINMDLEGLRRGVGGAEVEGGDGVIPAGQLRRLAVDAEYLPVVLGGDSEVLDLGRKRRFFSEAQRAALLVRDGGCAMCGAPPSHCEAHHIDFWRNGGVSDLANGVMLCVACHHTIHAGDWDIDASPHDVWFIPPAGVDPARRPRLGGRARFGVSSEARAELAAIGPPGDPEPPGHGAVGSDAAPPGSGAEVGDGEPPGRGAVVGDAAPPGPVGLPASALDPPPPERETALF